MNNEAQCFYGSDNEEEKKKKVKYLINDLTDDTFVECSNKTELKGKLTSLQEGGNCMGEDQIKVYEVKKINFELKTKTTLTLSQ